MSKSSAPKKADDIRDLETKRKGDPSAAKKSIDPVDRALEESFPSSDPPSFNPGSTITADDDAERKKKEPVNHPGGDRK